MRKPALVAAVVASGIVAGCVSGGPQRLPAGPAPECADAGTPGEVSLVELAGGQLASDDGAAMTAVLAHDLEMTGRLRFSRAGGDAAVPAYRITGGFRPGFLRLQVEDAGRACRLFGYDFPIADPAGTRRVVHQAADLIHETLLGSPGLALSRLAYVVRQDGLFHLVVADADGARPVTVARANEVLMSPAWSPDGEQLAFVAAERGRFGIYGVTLQTGVLRKIASEPGITGSPAWAPDGRRLAYVLSKDGSADIYVQDLETGERRRLTDDPGIDTEPSWSPDGRTIAFTSERDGRPRIFTLDVATAAVRPLTADGSEFRPRYSPDGRRIALVRQQRGYRIVLLELATGARRILSDGPQDESPSFAPNGLAIAYANYGADGRSRIRIVSLNGQVRRTLEGQDASQPAFSPLPRAPQARRITPWR